MNDRTMINEREARYGSMAANAQCTWELMEVFQKYNFARFSTVQKHLFYMTAHKMARMLCGDPNYMDNYVDIENYWKRASDFVPRGPRVFAEEAVAEVVQEILDDGPHDDGGTPLDESWKPGTPEDGGQHESAMLPKTWKRNKNDPLRDGTRFAPTWVSIPIEVEGSYYFLVDRNHYSEGAIEHLPRLMHVINNSEWLTLPPYYQPLYALKEGGGYTLQTQYAQHWGV